MKIHKGDTVKVMIGKDKGKSGEVFKVDPKNMMVFVQNVNQYKRHFKSRMKDQKSEIITITKPLHMSKVALLDPKKKKPARIGYKIVKGEKVRISRMSKEKV